MSENYEWDKESQYEIAFDAGDSEQELEWLKIKFQELAENIGRDPVRAKRKREGTDFSSRVSVKNSPLKS